MKRNIMKKAHQMTKEIVEKYPDVDYKTQLGLCLSFLSQEDKEVEEEMVELKGSEKQIAWAKDIRCRFVEICDKYELKLSKEMYIDWSDSYKWINNRKHLNDAENLIDWEMSLLESKAGGDRELFFNEEHAEEKREWKRLDSILDNEF